MKLKTLVLTAGLLAMAPLVMAQTTTNTKSVTVEVVAVHGQKLIYKMDGVVKEATIPASTRFDMGGKKLTLGELEPGSTVTATITTKTTEIPAEKIVTIKNADVLHVQGRTVIVRNEDKEIKKHVLPGDFPIYVDGKKLTVYQLKKGMKVSATITEEIPPVTLTEQQLSATAQAPVKPEPAPAPAPAAEKPAKLPKTGSHLPLLGLLGLLSMGAGAGLRGLRRRS